MVYLVVQVDNVGESSGQLLQSLTFPPSEMSAAVHTKILLLEVEHNVGGFFTLSYWKSLFNRKKDYNITIEQKDQQTNEALTYLLYSSTDDELSRKAFNEVTQTLTPLVDDCTLLLSEELLKAVILPTPTERAKLLFKINELMESNPDGHSNWVKVLQSLVLVAVRDDQDLEHNLAELHGNTLVRGATDGVGNTALHLAKSEKTMENLLTASKQFEESERKKLLSQQNRDGLDPLHIAFQQNKGKVINQLVHAGAELESRAADADESNPLHLAAVAGSSESVRALHQGKENFLQRDSRKDFEKEKFQNALNATNKNGDTPLMLSVCQNFLNTVVIFLQAGADPDFQNPINGNTALHYAAQMGCAPILKALLAFGAQVSIQNSQGKTPLDVTSEAQTVGPEDCKNIIEEMMKLTKEAEVKVHSSLDPVDIPSNAIFLLSMDGGGTRGLLLIQSLLAIQKRMKQLKPECRGIAEYFDYIAGTSAGGMIANSIGILGVTLESARSLIFKVGNEIFSKSVTYSDDAVEESLREACGHDTFVTDRQQPRVIAYTALANCSPPLLHPICNFGGARNGQKHPREWKVWESCRCTSAAPFYFTPYQDKFVDGGVMANNPTLDAMVEVLQQEEKEKTGRKLALVVSLGTGILPPSPRNDDVAIYVPNLNNLFTAIINIGDSISASVNFLHLLISQSTLADGQETTRAEAWCQSTGIPFYRISPPISQIVDLTETDVAVLTNMMLEGQKYLLRNADQVDAIARTLLSRDLD